MIRQIILLKFTLHFHCFLIQRLYLCIISRVIQKNKEKISEDMIWDGERYYEFYKHRGTSANKI